MAIVVALSTNNAGDAAVKVAVVLKQPCSSLTPILHRPVANSTISAPTSAVNPWLATFPLILASTGANSYSVTMALIFPPALVSKRSGIEFGELPGDR